MSPHSAKKVVLAGGSGFVGEALAASYSREGADVVNLSRSAASVAGARPVQWDGESLGAWAMELEAADLLINLCGSPITSVWTPANRKTIEDSRIKPTRILAEAAKSCHAPPSLWVNASAVGIYGDSGERQCDETSEPGQGFMADLCRKWEAAAFETETPGVRKVALRLGVVLGCGGAMSELSRLARAGLGSAIGNGRQFLSWIHIDDVVSLIDWCRLVDTCGPLVACSPDARTNAQFMATLRSAVGRPSVPPVPEFVFRSVCRLRGIQPDVLLESQHAFPTLALAKGFQFKFADLESAFSDLLRP